MINKRGISRMVDIVGAMMIFTALFVILMWIMGAARVQVHATVDAANAAFICQNDLSAALQFPSDGEQIKDVLVEDYSKSLTAENKYTNFESSITEIFNQGIGENKWMVQVLQYLNAYEEEPEELFKAGEIYDTENAQSCSSFIPIKCNMRIGPDEIYEDVLSRCTLEVRLTLSYEKQ